MELLSRSVRSLSVWYALKSLPTFSGDEYLNGCQSASVDKVVAKDSSRLAELELLAFLFSKDAANFWNYLAPSLDIFWPEVKVTAVLEDTKSEHRFAETLPPRYKVKYTTRFEGDATPGRKRHQLLKFYADEWTNAQYIGFVDSDTLFVTRPTEATLFQGQCPRIIAEVGKPKTKWYEGVPRSTMKFLGQEEVISCMSHFPLIYVRDHFAALRKHLIKQHGWHSVSDGSDLLTKLYSTHVQEREPWSFVEFNVMCNYVLRNYPDAYSFHFQELQPGWRGPLPEGQSPVEDLLMSTARRAWQPIARIAVHGGYLGQSWHEDHDNTKCGFNLPLHEARNCRWFPLAASKLVEGFCQASLCSRCLTSLDWLISGFWSLCNTKTSFVQGDLHRDMFRFEFTLTWDWLERDKDASRKAQAVHCRHVAKDCDRLNGRALLQFLQRRKHLDSSSNCVEDADISQIPKLVIIAGARWEFTDNWDCRDRDLVSYAVPEWGSVEAVHMRKWCAETCLSNPDCVSFTYPDSPGNAECHLKHLHQKSALLNTSCGNGTRSVNSSNSSSSDFYTLLDVNCQLATRSIL